MMVPGERSHGYRMRMFQQRRLKTILPHRGAALIKNQNNETVAEYDKIIGAV